MEDIKELKENVKEVLMKVEEVFGNVGKILFFSEELKNDRDLIRYVVKVMWVYWGKFWFFVFDLSWDKFVFIGWFFRVMEVCFKEYVVF